MLKTTIARFVREDDGMEMVEWAIVGVVFALASALIWTGLRDSINTALTDIGDCVEDSAKCPGGGS
jgi:Flp pilus assembly pilin Flp